VIAINLGGLGDPSLGVGLGNPVGAFEPAIRRALLARKR